MQRERKDINDVLCTHKGEIERMFLSWVMVMVTQSRFFFLSININWSFKYVFMHCFPARALSQRWGESFETSSFSVIPFSFNFSLFHSFSVAMPYRIPFLQISPSIHIHLKHLKYILSHAFFLIDLFLNFLTSTNAWSLIFALVLSTLIR